MSCYEPCPACNRHVVTDETTCPFCAAPLPGCLDKGQRAPARGRVSRSGLLAAGAGAALIAVGSCGSAYGTPPVDSGTMSGGTGGSGGAGGGGGGAPVPEYGAPPSFFEGESEPKK